MSGSGVYVRHNFVQWSARFFTVAAFSLCTGLYGLPLAVLLGLLATCAYCGVSYVCFTLEGREWRRSLEASYDRLFTSVYGAGSRSSASPRGRGPVGEERSASRERVQASLQCHKEAQKIILLIMRDFVLKWYEGVTTDLEFPEDCQKILEHVALEVNVRLQHLDLDEVVHELLAVILPYLEVVNDAGKIEYNGVEIFDVRHERCLRRFEENVAVAHRALRSPDAETRYYRQLLDAVIQTAAPDEYRNSDLACMFLREVLLHNILEPLLSLLCDPDFLNKTIPIILRKADPVAVQTILDHIKEENKQLEHSKLRGKVIQAHRRPPSMRRFHSTSDHYPKPIPVQLSRIHYPLCFSVPVRAVGGARIDEAVVVDVGEEVNVGVTNEEGGSDNSTNKVVSSSETECLDGVPLSLSPTSSLGSSDSGVPQEDAPTLTRKRSLFGLSSPFTSRKTSPQRRQTISRTDAARPMEQASHPPPIAKSSLSVATSAATAANAPSSSECDADAVVITLPPIFATRYVHIRHGNSTYIGYVFKFPKTMLSLGDLQELGLPSAETHLESVKRYSDFMRLHQQLQKSPELLQHAQGLGLPGRHGFANVMSKLPFTSRDLDPASLLERKQGLEKYIQLISSRPEILESDLFQEFLSSGVRLLREANSLNPHKTRTRRTLLGLMKGHSDDAEEAKPLPPRPMESVLSSFLNTSLPLPCRKLNTETNAVAGLPIKGSSRHSDRKPPLIKAATIGENSSNESSKDCSVEDNGRRRTASLSESERAVTRGANNNILTESESGVNSVIAMRGCDTKLWKGTRGNTNSIAMTTACQTEQNILTRAKSHLFHIFSLVWKCVHIATAIVYQCSLPLSQKTLDTLTKTQQSANPLSDVLLSLGTEASRSHCQELWVTDKSTQMAVLTLFGGGIDRFLMHELHIVARKEQTWMRALYNLRHTLWVDGSKELDRGPREKPTEWEREERKRQAASAFKKFLPNFLPYVVGSEDYNHAVNHCLECLQNPRINRHFFLRVVDILLPKLVPELHSEEFQKRLSRLRTLTSTHAHKVPNSRPSSTYSKKHV